MVMAEAIFCQARTAPADSSRNAVDLLAERLRRGGADEQGWPGRAILEYDAGIAACE